MHGLLVQKLLKKKQMFLKFNNFFLILKKWFKFKLKQTQSIFLINLLISCICMIYYLYYFCL